MIQDIVPLLESYIIKQIQINTALAHDLMTAFCNLAPATGQTTAQKVELLAILAAFGIIGVQMGRTLVSVGAFYAAAVAVATWRKGTTK